MRRTIHVFVAGLAATVVLGAQSVPQQRGTTNQQPPVSNQKDPEEVALVPVKPLVSVFISSGRDRSLPESIPMAPAAPPVNADERADVQIYDWIAYSFIKCDVDWGQTCEGTYLFDGSKQGWQACRFLGTEVSKGGWNSSFTSTPTSWYTNDPENPDRFRAYFARIRANGSPYPWHQVGAWIEIRNVGVRLIPAWANNYQRYSAQCEMPPHN